MKKTISLLMFLFVISGGVFSACNSGEVKVEDAIDYTVEQGYDQNKAIYDDEVEEKTQPKVEDKSADTSIKSSDTKEPVVTVKYLDGSYTQTGGYQSPAGPETVKVALTLSGDVVSGVTVTPMAVNETSIKFQGQFSSGISSLVVGKKLDEIGGFAQVNGSSLTPKAFDSALAAIKADALIKN